MQTAIVMAMSACAAMLLANDPVIGSVLSDVGLEVDVFKDAVNSLVKHFNAAGFFG